MSVYDTVEARADFEYRQRENARMYVYVTADDARANGGAVHVLSTLRQEWKFIGRTWVLYTIVYCTRIDPMPERQKRNRRR